MRNVLLAGTAGLLLALGAGAANAENNSVQPHYATALSHFFSSRSPLMDDHYGYDDRDTHAQPTEGRAAFVDSGAKANDHAGPSNP
jgi:hypothetical protein